MINFYNIVTYTYNNQYFFIILKYSFIVYPNDIKDRAKHTLGSIRQYFLYIFIGFSLNKSVFERNTAISVAITANDIPQRTIFCLCLIKYIKTISATNNTGKNHRQFIPLKYTEFLTTNLNWLFDTKFKFKPM